MITNFPNGVSSFGITLLGPSGGNQVPFTTGTYWFVSSLVGNDSNSGKDPQHCFKTLGQAITSSTAAAGDVIILMPGHVETYSSATALNISKSGVAVIGLGTGNLRPTFTLDTGTSTTITVSAANVLIYNVMFIANFAAIVSYFTLTTAKDFNLLSCHFRDTDATHNALAIVTTDTTSNHADGLTIDSCRWISQTATAAIAVVTPLGTNDRWKIVNNFMQSVTTSGAAIIPIATGKVLTNLLIQNNVFNLKGATGTATGYLITTDGSTSSGFITGNMLHNLATTPLLVTASSGIFFGINYHVDQPDTSGYILPAQDS